MNQSYDDILEKLGEPLWWDCYGVPRYGNPDNLDVKFFTNIYCQSCGRKFYVATVDSVYKAPYSRELDPVIKEDILEGAYYGDPPRHACPAGNTMSSLTESEWKEGL